MNINEYFNDGAHWQAKVVLAYLQYRAEDVYYASQYKTEICISRYKNCREQGYVFTLNYNGKQRHYAVYEHRNSDKLCVLISNKLSMGTPDVDTMWADKPENATKYDVDASFKWGDYMKCGDYILEDMVKAVNNWKPDETDLET